MENIRSYYNRFVGFIPTLKCLQPSMTEQHHKNACDVNYILEVFNRTGQLPAPTQGIYDDVSNRPDNLLDCMNVVREANELFMSIPSDIRAKFNNDPVVLLDWISRAENREEAENIGLLSKRVAPENLQGAQSAQNPDLMLNVPTDTNNEKVEK